MNGSATRRHRDESGQLAGIEALPLGLLVFVIGALVVANAWAVIDAKFAAVSAAREASRAYVEARSADDADAESRSAAQGVVKSLGRDPQRLRLTASGGGFARCDEVTFEARYPVPAITLPWLGGFGQGFWATARHTEVVDPLRSGVPLGARECDTTP